MTFFYDDDLDKFPNKDLIVFNGEKKKLLWCILQHVLYSISRTYEIKREIFLVLV